MRRWVAVVVLLLAACSSSLLDGELPDIDGPGLREVLADLERPAVVNLWASWCLPCRAEAPLLVDAHARHGEEIAFIGVAVQDAQSSAQDFIDEFGIRYVNYFDDDRSVPAELGGFGLPITYFVGETGAVVETHSGVLDEETLATQLEELLART